MFNHSLVLYAGLGGCCNTWTDTAITAVEWGDKIAQTYKTLHPEDRVIVADAHQYLLDHYKEYDFFWASPPCQSHSKMIRSGRNRKPRYPDFKLYEEIVFLHHNAPKDALWVVENVKPYYTPLVEPSAQIGRHLFWSNFPIPDMPNPPTFKNFINRQNLTAQEELKEWLGLHYEGSIYYENNHCPTQVLRNAVHPAIGQWVYDAAVAYQQSKASRQ